MKKIALLIMIVLASSMYLAFGPEVEFGTTTLGTESYFRYGIHYPITDIVPGLDLDIGFSAYQTEIAGPLYFGKPNPSATPSTNVINGLTLYGIRLHNNVMDIRYGDMGYYSKGIGLLFDSYTKYDAYAFDAELVLFNPGVSIHIPFEITSFVPLGYKKTSSLWWGGIIWELPFNIHFDTTLVWESNSVINEVESPTSDATDDEYKYPILGLTTSADFRAFDWKLFRFAPSVEFAGLTTRKFDHYGLSVGLGGRLSILDMIWFKGGGLWHYKDFVPGYFDLDYEYKKFMMIYHEDKGIKLPALRTDVDSGFGWFLKGSFNIGKFVILQANIEWYDHISHYTPLLEGYLRVRIPEVNIGDFNAPEFFLEGKYYQNNFEFSKAFSEDWKEGLLNDNTRLSLGIIYPLALDTVARFKMQYNPGTAEFNYNVMFETDFKGIPEM
ncbi:MAG: hypothetical protein R6U52_06470 [Kosmotogaceae bacterium]